MSGKCLLVGLVAVALVCGTTTAWGAILVNGDFEDTSGTFPLGSGWELDGKPNNIIQHPGLVGGSTTAAMCPSTSGRVKQDFAETGPNWQLDFYFAAEAPTDRTLNMGIKTAADSSAQINFRVSNSGKLQAYSGGWTDIASGVVSYSTDVGGDNDYTDPGDTLNVHRMRIVGNYHEATPNYDVMISNAGSTNVLDNVFSNIQLFYGAPPAGDGLVRISFEGDDINGDYILDNMTLTTIPEPGTFAMLAAGGVAFCLVLWGRRKRGRR